MMLELSSLKKISLYLLLFSLFLTFLLTCLFVDNNNSFVNASVLLLLLGYTLVIIIFKSKYALLNPLFFFCLLQLSLYLLNWFPFVFSDVFLNDTYTNYSFNKYNVINAIVKLNILTTLWLISALITQIMIKLNVTWVFIDKGFNYKIVSILLILFSFFSFYYLLNVSGSFYELMIQRELTRTDRISDSIGRHWFAFSQVGIIGFILWLFTDNNFSNRWFFIPLLFLILSIGFIVSGNRTSIVISCLIVCVGIYTHNKKILSKPIILISIILIVMISFTTVIREEGFSKLQYNLSSFNNNTGKENVLNKILKIRTERLINGSASIGILIYLDNNGDYLLGDSFKSILFIPVPSIFLDADKPAAGGKLAAKILANRSDTAWPISPVVEAYWNFSYIGVVISGVMYGFLSSFIFSIMKNNNSSTFVLLCYFTYMTTFTTGSDGFYKFFQAFIPLLLIYFFIQIYVMYKRV